MSATMLETLVEQVATLTRERDEARAKLEERFKSLDSALELAEATRVQLVEARADAARKGEALKELVEWCDKHENESPPTETMFRADEALADTTSEAWLAEVRATARDEALEEAADCFGMTADQERIRALKRGGK